MTKDDIKEEFDGFIEFPPGSDGLFVTTTSTMIFAEHVAGMMGAEIARLENELLAMAASRDEYQKAGYTIANELRAELAALKKQEPVAWFNTKRDMTYMSHFYKDDVPLFLAPGAQPMQEGMVLVSVAQLKTWGVGSETIAMLEAAKKEQS